MPKLARATSVSLIALAAAFALPGTAEALPCVLGTGSDVGHNTCVGTAALLGLTSGGDNTAMGYNALKNTTSGYYNTAIGAFGLNANLTGYDNTGLGYYALGSSTAGNGNTAVGYGGMGLGAGGNYNTAVGNSSSLYTETGEYNVSLGYQSLYYNSSGSRNIAIGYRAGFGLQTGSDNIDIGSEAVYTDNATIRIGTQGTQTKTFLAGVSGVTVSGGQAVVVDSNGQLGIAPAIPGTSNVALGGSALIANTTGNYNTAAGTAALSFNTTGAGNSASGASALGANTTGNNNTASGASALLKNTVGNNNTGTGANALRNNTLGSFNTASGVNSLQANTTGARNVAIGFEAAKLQTTGSSNTAIGFKAGYNWTTGSSNIAIANLGVAGEQKTIRIGVQGTQTKTFVAGIRGINVTGGQAVVVSSTGQLGVVSSSRRYKQDIQPMGDASDGLLKLRPVTFRYKQPEADGSRPLQYGLIAEDVAETMPQLAVYNDEGQPESVAYQLLPSLLLNEYQKQAKELDETKAQLASMEAEMAAMKLMLQRLAATQSGKTQLASAP